MKVYIAEYHNGEAYEDFHQWRGESVYRNKQDCENEILKLGFKFNVEEKQFELICDDWNSHYANIGELGLI